MVETTRVDKVIPGPPFSSRWRLEGGDNEANMMKEKGNCLIQCSLPFNFLIKYLIGTKEYWYIKYLWNMISSALITMHSPPFFQLPISLKSFCISLVFHLVSSL